jgi:hypothetical protein
MRRIRHGAQQHLVEAGKRSSRATPANSGFGGPITAALIATPIPNGTYISSQLSRGSTCRRIRYRRAGEGIQLRIDSIYAPEPISTPNRVLTTSNRKPPLRIKPKDDDNRMSQALSRGNFLLFLTFPPVENQIVKIKLRGLELLRTFRSANGFYNAQNAFKAGTKCVVIERSRNFPAWVGSLITGTLRG